ncbi:hypothetical protein BOTNAR_0292g00060 [Botryotinia narcissicola]|uniref:Uncharacterized protein n=1 Tax=Botryotinia narcissicola TaxID=278944 RepID=A0A4Z1HWI3_9HELO|nr:hypothetical protein BOTNAR_0292g00060 [Botryotinia narcissicola]
MYLDRDTRCHDSVHVLPESITLHLKSSEQPEARQANVSSLKKLGRPEEMTTSPIRPFFTQRHISFALETAEPIQRQSTFLMIKYKKPILEVLQ